MTWQDDGVKLLLDISTSGTFITSPLRVEYPFSGSTSSVSPPTGWSAYLPTGSTSADLYMGTNSGIANTSQSTNNTIPTYSLGITRTFTVTPNHRYRIEVLVRGNTGLGPTTYPSLSVGFIPTSGSTFYRSVQTYSGGLPDSANWYGMSVDQDTVSSTGVGVTSITVTLMARIPLDAPTNAKWGCGWTDVAITDVTTATAPTFTWRNVECDTMDAIVRYGRARFTERYDVGTFGIKLNNVSGEYMYQDPHPWGLRPGRMLRMRAQYGGNTYPVCFGVIDRINTVMTLDGKANVTMQVFDTTSYTSDTPTPQISFMSESVQNDPDALSGNRVHSLLNYAGVAQSLRAIDPGKFAMQNVKESSRGLREEIGVTADSEGGSFFAERDGTIVFRDRSWSTRDPRGGTVQANFTAFRHGLNIDLQPDEVPTDPNAPVICPQSMDTDWSMERVINAITLATAGTNKRYYNNSPSQQENGIRTYQRLDYLNWSGANGTVAQQLDARAADIFSTSLEALLRVKQISYRPNASTWVWTFTAFLDWLVRVFYFNDAGTWGFATVVRIQSLEHRITPTDWQVTVNVDQPISYTDDVQPSPDGGWDVADWDAAVWDDELFTKSALWSAGFRWSNPESKWGE